ncbi:uncharacterized protein LOC108091368 [Drosophila ficusphila]|uniref:uncharacterized protein LOC108091368 n=1 Tax=Drosophila ficusphila TaxID=30025 RepID=UPI0007E829DB|nr:uncharacterized protein LOC108091368 [Drosophila ficusphila]
MLWFLSLPISLVRAIIHPAYNILIHGKILKRANGYKPWLFDLKFDACKYLRHPGIPIVGIVYGLFKEFTNINHTCPYVGPQIIQDFYLRYELLQLPFPSGEYMLALRWFFDRKVQFDTNVSFTLVEDILKRN